MDRGFLWYDYGEENFDVETVRCSRFFAFLIFLFALAFDAIRKE